MEILGMHQQQITRCNLQQDTIGEFTFHKPISVFAITQTIFILHFCHNCLHDSFMPCDILFRLQLSSNHVLKRSKREQMKHVLTRLAPTSTADCGASQLQDLWANGIAKFQHVEQITITFLQKILHLQMSIAYECKQTY